MQVKNQKCIHNKGERLAGVFYSQIYYSQIAQNRSYSGIFTRKTEKE